MSKLLQTFLHDSARRYPGTTAIDDGSEVVCYSGLLDRTEAFRTRFLDTGLQAGQRVAVFSTNNIDYVALYFACAELGLVIVPMNAHLKADEIRWILEDCAPAALVVEADYLERFSGCNDINALRFAIGSLDTENEWTSLCRYRQTDLPKKPAGVPGVNDPAIQMYTSGTTGTPKGVVLSHTNMTSLVLSWLEEMPLAAEQSRFMQATPLFHVGGLLVCLSTIASGATLYLLPKFEPELARDTLLTKRITDTLLVPAMVHRVLQLPDIGQHDFAGLNTLVYGASLMPTATLRRAHEVFGCHFLQGYGLTETSGVALCLRPQDHSFSSEPLAEKRLTAAGKPLSCCEVRVVDANLEDVKSGTVGEIAVRGSNVMPGYWNNPDATAETIVNGWLLTGDLGTQDDDGYIYVVGRSKDMINFSGENVYPAEIENLLSAHPAIDEIAVIGVPHERTGEEVVAVIVTNNSYDTGGQALHDELQRYTRKHLADFKCPTRYIEAVDLPRTPAGKVQKHILKEQHS